MIFFTSSITTIYGWMMTELIFYFLFYEKSLRKRGQVQVI
jgi:hypothetical protein